mgnify:CR=1 FL=1
MEVSAVPQVSEEEVTELLQQLESNFRDTATQSRCCSVINAWAKHGNLIAMNKIGAIT